MISGYQDRYCLFLDILGFKEIIESSLQPGSRLGKGRPPKVYFSLKQIASALNYKMLVYGRSGKGRPSSRRVTQFSDSVVLSYKASEPGSLSGVLFDVLQLQLKLISRGILVRGGIARGLLYHEDDFVFGPALNEAAELEKAAMYPRVIVDRDVLAGHSDFVSSDLDGMYYVDYFNVDPEWFSDWGEMVEYLIGLRELIKKLSLRKDISIRLKHSWLREKFNNVIRPLETSKYKMLAGNFVPKYEDDHVINLSSFR